MHVAREEGPAASSPRLLDTPSSFSEEATEYTGKVEQKTMLIAGCKLPTESPIPPWATNGDLYSVTRTAVELSVICRQDLVPAEVVCERGWCCLRVAGTMPFTLVGVLASLTMPIAKAGVGIFAFFTYDTDYLLTKVAEMDRAITSPRAAGHEVVARNE